jgi:hypothetical protein
LTIARAYLTSHTIGDYVYIGGGLDGQTSWSRVDVLNSKDLKWSIMELSVARHRLVSVSIANRYGLWAGGCIYSPQSTTRVAFDVVDIYDANDGTWSTSKLRNGPRYNLAATTVSERFALFGGGFGTEYSKLVDVFDINTMTWGSTSLTIARSSLAAVSIGNQAFFVGGFIPVPKGQPDSTDVVDIITISVKGGSSWSSISFDLRSVKLSWPRFDLVGCSIVGYVMFAGNSPLFSLSFIITISWFIPLLICCDVICTLTGGYGGNLQVEIFDTNGNLTLTTLSQARNLPATTVVGGMLIVGGGESWSVTASVDIFSFGQPGYMCNYTNSPNYTCTKCHPTRYTPIGGMTTCLTCMEGTFTLTSGQSSCFQCLSGSYCTDGGTNICPKGYFCAREGMSEPTPCLPGYYCDRPDLRSAASCPIGSYCPG